MLVSGGLGGLGIIASFHCASEFENPIITTSRSGRLPPSAGAHGMQLYEAIREIVPIYNVQLDVGNAKALSDLFAWLNRPGVPFEERTMMIDDILAQLKYKMQGMPQDALASIQDFLFEMRDKLTEVITDLMSRETKVDQQTVSELQEKVGAVTEMINRLAPKVGTARMGRCQLIGGVPPPSYAVPEGGYGGEQQQAVGQSDQDRLMSLMQEEMRKAPGASGSRDPHALSQQALEEVVADIKQEGLLQSA